MKIQYQLSNGNWTDAGDRAEGFIERAISNKQKTRAGWVKMDRQTVIEYLNRGAELRISPEDWYSNIRDLDAVSRIQNERQSSQAPVEMVKCSCGHTVPKISMMSASLGTSCPDCYDRMSA